MEDIQFSGQDEEPGERSLLIKTLIPSPVIKDVLEANLSAPNSKDIIFIKVFPFVASTLT